MNRRSGIRITRYRTLAFQIAGVCVFPSVLAWSFVGRVAIVPIWLVGVVLLFSNTFSVDEGRVHVRIFFQKASWPIADVGLTSHKVYMNRVTSIYAALTINGQVVPIFAYGLGSWSNPASKRLNVLQKKLLDSTGLEIPIIHRP